VGGHKGIDLGDQIFGAGEGQQKATVPDRCKTGKHGPPVDTLGRRTHECRRFQPIAPGNAAKGMTVMPELAVTDEMHDLVLNGWQGDSQIAKGNPSRPIEHLTGLQESRFPRPREQLPMELYLDQCPSPSDRHALADSASGNVASRQQRLSTVANPASGTKRSRSRNIRQP
jgi:hypothetical protein